MRVATRKLPATAAVGDLAVFLAFPFLGAASHAMGLTLDTFVRTVIPFAGAWVLVGALARGFTPAVVRSPSRTLLTVPVAWLAAGALGVALRSLLFNRPLDLTFALVSIGVIGLMLLVWRLVLAVTVR